MKNRDGIMSGWGGMQNQCGKGHEQNIKIYENGSGVYALIRACELCPSIN